MIIIKSIIPYDKDIKFDTKIYEITSISLEHEEQNLRSEVNGNFIITGDYKIHPISITKEAFEYKIPFTIELIENVDINSIKIDINDFTYDIKGDDTLNVKIDLIFEYDEKENIEVEEIEDIEIPEIIEDDVREEKEVEEVKNIEEVSSASDTYVMYHVYAIDESDTIESICKKFNVSKEMLHDYNEFDELSVGSKLIIPECNES